MPIEVVTGKGQSLTLGRELGRGGEGSVFEIVGSKSHVAKVYHQIPDAAKQNKLVEMTRGVDDRLLRYTAWPQDLVFAKNGGHIIGFVMGSASGLTPLHEIYSPAHRKQEHPDWGWDFLVFVARNLAAAFAVLHNHGHVLGDVNQGNAFAGGDSRVVLIDCDSYQTSAGGRTHLCEVGVPHYTPPELQTLKSFASAHRTPNHDNFGLAVLIFHLLFGGRHPFAGVPLANGVGDTLEDNIRHHRYAYASNASARQIAPPPNSIPMSLVPSAMREMFERAFTEVGSQGNRPSAKEWVDALDLLRRNLKQCSKGPIHQFSAHLQSCPWCSLEQQSIVYFIALGAVGSNFGLISIQDVWNAINQIPVPPDPALPLKPTIEIKAKPRPASLVLPGAKVLGYMVLAVVVVGALMVAPKVAAIWIMLGIGGWAGLANWGDDALRTERRARWTVKQAADEQYNTLVAQFRRECGSDAFVAKLKELTSLKSEFDGLPQREAQEIQKLQSTNEARQKARYLERFFIDKAGLPGIGPVKLASLRSFGIETAADVEWNRIIRLKGFGEVLTRTLVDWRKQQERGFKYNPALGVTENDRRNVRATIHGRKIEIEARLKAGLQYLRRFNETRRQSIANHMPRLQEAFNKKAQADADFKVL